MNHKVSKLTQGGQLHCCIYLKFANIIHHKLQVTTDQAWLWWLDPVYWFEQRCGDDFLHINSTFTS